ncbi:MAG: DUF3576 domain-containing protein [Rickettsiales bacterium]
MPLTFFFRRASALSLCALLLANCAGPDQDAAPAPKDLQDRRRQRIGKLSGDEGLVIFGKRKSPGAGDGGGVSGIGVNSYLWRATLDTVGFMPLVSADPFGGAVITDWYQDPQEPNERFKINAVILGKELRSNNVTVRLFRQIYDKKRGSWFDAAPAPKANLAVEDKILARAKELRVADMPSS